MSFCSKINQPVPSGFANTHFTALIILLSIYYVCQMPEKNKFCKKKKKSYHRNCIAHSQEVNKFLTCLSPPIHAVAPQNIIKTPVTHPLLVVLKTHCLRVTA